MPARHLVVARLLDPLALALIALAVVLVILSRTKGPRTRAWQAARVGAWAVWVGLYVLSCPYLSNFLVHHAEGIGPDLTQALANVPEDKLGMVVLSGGMRSDNRGFPASELIDGTTQERVIGAARVYREHPSSAVIASGGPYMMSKGMSELLMLLGVPEARIVREDQSTSTRENGTNSVAIAKERGLTHVIVVTSAMHIPRALIDFERASAGALTIIPAPADPESFEWMERAPITDFFPSSESLFQAGMTAHEILGRKLRK